MPKPLVWSPPSPTVKPNYQQLIQFLVEPLLESPESLSVDCEQLKQNRRVWIRLAFEGMDKGRVFGRGGRNLQAIRIVLETTAATAGQSVYLDIYEDENQHSSSRSRDYRQSDNRPTITRRKQRSRRSSSPSPPSPRFSFRPPLS